MTTRLTRWLAAGAMAFLCTSFLTACGGGESTPETPPPAALGTIEGQALSSVDSAPVSGATVSAGGQSTTTAADGAFTLQSVPAGARVVVKLAAPDFIDAIVPVAVTAGGTARAQARLVPAGSAVTVDAASNATASAAGSLAAVDLSANSLAVASTGADAIGALRVRVTPIDPASDPQNMPGDYRTNDDRTIESFGAVKFSLEDASGNRLNLKPGRTATIRIPLASRSAAAPASIPLFYLNETSGQWVQEGSATLMGTAPNQYYEGSVSHFSYWNADMVQETIFVHGCVNDAASRPAPGVVVRSIGIDYSGTARAVTDAAGRFSVAIRKNGRASIYGDAGNVTNTIQVGPSATDITLATCLAISATPTAPSIVVQPSGLTLEQGLPAAFEVVASGSRPLTYQWQRNGVDIAGARSSHLFLPTTLGADNGARYSVVVSNAAGTLASSAAVLTLTAPLPPSIVTAPAAASVEVGQTAQFTVLASGSGGLSYQWQRNGADIAGAATAAYRTPVLQLADNGTSYRVVVTSVYGTVTSAGALLTVTASSATPPSITSQPSGMSVTLGQTASFSVSASGSATLAYQWRRNGTDIAGATDSSYTTPVTLQSDNGAVFSVRVSNAHGSVTSDDAVLTVSADDTAEKLKLMRLLTLSYSFYEAAAAPFELLDDAFVFLNPAAVCQSGGVSGTFNGAAITAGQSMPPNGTLAATFSVCTPDGLTTYTGASSVSFNFTAVDPESGSATATVNNMRLRRLESTASNAPVLSDFTANGTGTTTFVSSVAGADTTSTITVALGNGATLRNELSGLSASFASGSVATRFVTTPDAGPLGIRTKQMRFSYNDLRLTIAGVNYVANGFYQLDFATSGAIASGSGEVLLTADSVTVGRVYATDQGVFIEVNGTVQPFAVRRPAAIR